jgi:hypothetical protein
MSRNRPSPASEPTPVQCIDLVLDPGSVVEPQAAGTMAIARGTVAGRVVFVAATNPSVARGAIGTAESAGLAAMLRQARADKIPVVLLLDSSGARVDEGLTALGAFRRLFREALLTRLAGVPMIALLGKACFGGASMLACVCTRRVYTTQTRFAASGPGVIEAISGKPQFDAADANSIDALMGGEGRTRTEPTDLLIGPTPAERHNAVLTCIEDKDGRLVSWNADVAHVVLGMRLRQAGMLDDAPRAGALTAKLNEILPKGYAPVVDADVFSALPPPGSGKAAFMGTLTGAPVGAATCWRLADRLLGLRERHATSPVVLMLDANGHSTALADERVMLSTYLVHLSLVIAALTAAGRRIVLWIPGMASGASYVAFAAPVEQVSVLPAARVEILPAAAVRQILGAEPARSFDISAMVEAGVADGLLDGLLQKQSGLERQ